jgi:hypothetical protein
VEGGKIANSASLSMLFFCGRFFGMVFYFWRGISVMIKRYVPG